MEEFVTSMIGFNLIHISRVLHLLHLLPDNYNLVQRIYTSFKNLHYESPTLNDPLGVMYSIPASRVHELRGAQYLTSLTDQESNVIKDRINCCIGRIPLHWWNNLTPHPTLKERDFISFNDLQPTRYALSYVPQLNVRVEYVSVAFIALDSEKLGIHVNDSIHVDFGDNKFPYFLGNKKNKAVEEEDIDIDETSYLSKEQIQSLKKYIPQSILSFLSASL